MAILNHSLVGAAGQDIQRDGRDDAGITTSTGVGIAATHDAVDDATRTKDSCVSVRTTTKRALAFLRVRPAPRSSPSVSWCCGHGAVARSGQDSGEDGPQVRTQVKLVNGGTRGIFLAGPVLPEQPRLQTTSADGAGDAAHPLARAGPSVPLLWCDVD